MRMAAAFLAAFAVTALIGKWLVPFLRRIKAGQSIKEIGPTWHMSKQGTPTMGGLMFILGAAAAAAAAIRGAGYWLWAALLAGSLLGAAAGIPSNLVQSALGIAASALLAAALRRSPAVRREFPRL